MMDTVRRVGIVFVGGGLGSCLRSLLLTWLAPPGSVGPVLLANLLGAFVLGVVFVLADEAGLLRAPVRLFLAVGVLGGFTTFSTFAWGADSLFAHHASGAAVVYVAASILGGVGAVSLGLIAGRALVAQLERLAVGLLVRLGERGLRRIDARTAMNLIETEDREESA